MKDDYLIKRIRAGDENAAEELIRGYYPQIMRFCRWQCGNRELAEDLAQETLFRVFRSLDQYRKKGHFKAWLYSIAKSVCIDELRKRRVEREPGQDIADIGDEGNGIRQVEDEEEIRQLLSLLPEEQREALILHYMEGFTFREMGEILDIPGRTAQSRVNLALKNLTRERGKNMRNIKRYLRHYECHETPEHMEETIAECRMIVRNSIASVHSRSGFMEFLSEVFRMNGVIILGGQISTLIVVCLIIRTVNDYPKLIPMFIPFFILAALPILFRAEIYRMGEIELATRNSCAQLLLARLIIIGAADMVCFTLLLAVEVFLFHTGQGLINLILYVFVPYMLCVTIILRLIRIGRHGFTSCIGMAIIVSVLWGIMASLIPNLYTASAIGVWMICFIVFGLFFSYEIKNLISIVKEGTAYGFVS